MRSENMTHACYKSDGLQAHRSFTVLSTPVPATTEPELLPERGLPAHPHCGRRAKTLWVCRYTRRAPLPGTPFARCHKPLRYLPLA